MGVFHTLRWGAIVYTPRAWEGKLIYVILHWFVSWKLIPCCFAGFPHCRVPPNSAEICGILPKFRISTSSIGQLACPLFSITMTYMTRTPWWIESLNTEDKPVRNTLDMNKKILIQCIMFKHVEHVWFGKDNVSWCHRQVTTWRKWAISWAPDSAMIWTSGKLLNYLLTSIISQVGLVNWQKSFMHWQSNSLMWYMWIPVVYPENHLISFHYNPTQTWWSTRQRQK